MGCVRVGWDGVAELDALRAERSEVQRRQEAEMADLREKLDYANTAKRRSGLAGGVCGSEATADSRT
jgi:hypothetical protein